MAPLRPKPAPDPERQLMIKTKVCQRIRKELDYYKAEVLENEGIVQKMKDDGADPYDVKRYQQVLQESYMMVPDSEKRLVTAVQDLNDFLTTPGLNSAGEWFVTAQAVLQVEQQPSAAASLSKSKQADADGLDAPQTNVDGLAPDEAF